MVATKAKATVAGQTSVRAPEKAAFEAHLPKDVHILSCHSLHGSIVSPVGQPLVLFAPLCLAQRLTDLLTQVLIQHRASKDALSRGEYHPRFVYLSFDGHDSVTANTMLPSSGEQSVALLSTLSMIDGRLFFRTVPSCDQCGYCLDFHRRISMRTRPLCWWNRDCQSEPHASDLFERLVCLCRTRHLKSQRPYSNSSICRSAS